MKVINNKDSVESALKKFRKKVSESGHLQELREREHYTKPSIKRKVARSRAKNRWTKYLQQQQLPKKLY